MIVRNESAKIARCLASAAPFVDHMLIVDTGSTDDTIEIAESYGAEVLSIPWPGSFDEARNYGFDRVKTQWTLWIDADEWILDGSGPFVREASKRWDASAYFVTRFDRKPDGSFIGVELVRLWRTHPAMRVFGVVHENFMPAAFEEAALGRPVLRSPIQLGHDGYEADAGGQKVLRNIELLRKHIAERPPSFYHEAHLYFALCNANEPEGVEGFRSLAKRIVARWPEHAQETMAPVVLGSMLAQSDEKEIEGQLAESCLAIIEESFPFSLTAMWECYRVYMRRGNRTAAKRILDDMRRRFKSGQYERLNPMHPRLEEVVDAAWQDLLDR